MSKDWKPDGPDFRTLMAPRFQGDAISANLALVARVQGQRYSEHGMAAVNT